jgi:alginate O-acetyltransferase complex protein AlgI
MWLLACAIYAGCKWQSFWSADLGNVSATRALGYLLFWPGMDPSPFFAKQRASVNPAAGKWIAALCKTILGVLLIFVGARSAAAHSLLLAGWVGMVGGTLVLHFGSFHLLALAWQAAGVNAQPIMHAPLLSASLAEFWGQRWNLGFRQLTYELVFQPLLRSAGPRVALFVSFLVSGLVHDLVISVPAGGGYGLPTAYFLLQGAGVLVERSQWGKRLGLQRGFRGRFFLFVFTATPLFWLFHPPFVTQVILPFLRAISAL